MSTSDPTLIWLRRILSSPMMPTGDQLPQVAGGHGGGRAGAGERVIGPHQGLALPHHPQGHRHPHPRQQLRYGLKGSDQWGEGYTVAEALELISPRPMQDLTSTFPGVILQP